MCYVHEMSYVYEIDLLHWIWHKPIVHYPTGIGKHPIVIVLYPIVYSIYITRWVIIHQSFIRSSLSFSSLFSDSNNIILDSTA